MSDQLKTLKNYIRELINEVEEELDEATTTGNVAGYQTPNAFGDGSKKSKKKTKDVATSAGYDIVNEGTGEKTIQNGFELNEQSNLYITTRFYIFRDKYNFKRYITIYDRQSGGTTYQLYGTAKEYLNDIRKYKLEPINHKNVNPKEKKTIYATVELPNSNARMLYIINPKSSDLRESILKEYEYAPPKKDIINKTDGIINLIGNKGVQFILKPETKVFQKRSTWIFTDGKQAMWINYLKPVSIVKKLGRAGNNTKNLYNNAIDSKRYNEDTIPGGISDNKSLEDIANHHKVDIDTILPEYRKGVKVEMEHTSDPKIAAEITRDHLYEDPKYYTKLSTIENESVNERLGMDMKSRRKIYDKLKKGDKVKITYGSSIKKGHQNTFVVTSPHRVVGKQKVGRIIMKNVDNMGGTKYFLYNRNGNVGMAIGDMGAVIKSMELINESVNEVSKITMSNLDWGKSTAERNANLDKYNSLKSDKEKNQFLKKLKGESVNEEKVYIDFLNKKKGFKRDRIKFDSYEKAVKWAKKNFEKFHPDMIHYESVNEGKKSKRTNRWLELKNDETKPNKKLAMGLKELKYKLREVENFIRWYNKISKMNELSSDSYWKRTNNHIYKIKERLINIARTIQELEK